MSHSKTVQTRRKRQRAMKEVLRLAKIAKKAQRQSAKKPGTARPA